MNAANYWLMAREYSIWNAAVAALQFWTADLKAHILSSTIEQVYNALLYSTSTHLLCQQSDEILFSHFMTTLNAAFESKLALEDEGYESGSENFNIPTPLRRTSKIHHISSAENVFFDPNSVTLCSTGTRESHHRPVHGHLTYSSSEDDDNTPSKIPSPDSTPQGQYHVDALQQLPCKYTLNAYVNLDEEEDFQTVSMDIGIWKRFLIDIYVSINIHYHTDYAHICDHIQITKLPHTMIPLIWVTSPSLKIWCLHPAMKTSLHYMKLDTKWTMVRNDLLYEL